ncbi:hypothetical protein NT07LI_3195, partial [Listeria innocua FSL S4-378]
MGFLLIAGTIPGLHQLKLLEQVPSFLDVLPSSGCYFL